MHSLALGQLLVSLVWFLIRAGAVDVIEAPAEAGTRRGAVGRRRPKLQLLRLLQQTQNQPESPVLDQELHNNQLAHTTQYLCICSRFLILSLPSQLTFFLCNLKKHKIGFTRAFECWCAVIGILTPQKNKFNKMSFGAESDVRRSSKVSRRLTATSIKELSSLIRRAEDPIESPQVIAPLMEMVS